MNRPLHRGSRLSAARVLGILGFFLFFTLLEAPHFHYSPDGEIEQECDLCHVVRAGDALIAGRLVLLFAFTFSVVSPLFDDSFVSVFQPKHSPRAPPAIASL